MMPVLGLGSTWFESVEERRTQNAVVSGEKTARTRAEQRVGQ